MSGFFSIVKRLCFKNDGLGGPRNGLSERSSMDGSSNGGVAIEKWRLLSKRGWKKETGVRRGSQDMGTVPRKKPIYGGIPAPEGGSPADQKDAFVMGCGVRTALLICDRILR